MHGKYRKPDAISLPNTSFCVAQIFPNCVASEIFKPFREGGFYLLLRSWNQKMDKFLPLDRQKTTKCHSLLFTTIFAVKLDLVSTIRVAPPNLGVSITTQNGVSDKAIHSTAPRP